MDENKNMEQQENATPENAENNEQQVAGDQQEAVTIESLMADMAKLKAENAKNKAALDKALHNNGELTKQLRAKMTASEQEEEAKREAEEAQRKMIAELQQYKLKSEARERYLTLGMNPEHARLAAEAEAAGDMEALSRVQQKHTEALLKAKEAEWLKSRPDIKTGHDEDKPEEDPFLVGFNSYGKY